MKYLFVLNPISGDVTKDPVTDLIAEYAKKYNWEYKVFKTTGNDDESKLKEIIEGFNPKIVVAGGGDGTVNFVAKHVVHTNIALGILPLGSGNGLSKDLGIPQNITKALDAFIRPNIIAIDSLLANGHPFFHICDIGFNARVVKLFNEGEKRGFWPYFKFTVKEFFRYRTSYYRIITDTGSFKGRAFMITAANSRQFGSNITINPEGRVNDGIFEIIVIKHFPMIQTFKLIYQLLLKKIHYSPYSKVLICKEAEIRFNKKKLLQYDGELAGKVRNVHLKIMPSSLLVIIPFS